jgi:hypothetical protein
MKKSKKLLLSFLALNTVFSAYGAEKSTDNTKYDRMYNNIIKNMAQGKADKKNYQVIENVLKQKNKELKDLYLQNDYIIKPEFLEWQIFFTGFYDEYNEGRDNSSENALYHSKVTGYYDTNGSYIVTSGFKDGTLGKPYKELQQPKEIDLGVNVPISGITRPPLNLNITPNSGSGVTGNYGPITIASPSVSPGVNIVPFIPTNPEIVAPGLPLAPDFTIRVTSYCNTFCSTIIARGGKGNTSFSQADILANPLPAISYSWAGMTPSTGLIFKSFLDTSLMSDFGSSGIAPLLQEVTIDSIPEAPYTSSFGGDVTSFLNDQFFYVGGSRVGSINNYGTAGINNYAKVNMIGFNVIGFEAQTLGGNQIIENHGIISDEIEKDNAYVQSVPSSFSMLRADSGTTTESITVNKSADGYIGYKVGMAYVDEGNKASAATNYSRFENYETIEFYGPRSIAMLSYIPGYSDLAGGYNATDAGYRVFWSNKSGGDIILHGSESYGIKIGNAITADSTVYNEGIIRFTKGFNVDKPDNSIGMAAIEDPGINPTKLQLRVNIYNGVMKNTSTGTIMFEEGTTNSTGMYLKVLGNNDITNEGLILIDSTAGKKNMGMRVDLGSIDLGTTPDKNPVAINGNSIEINGANTLNETDYVNYGMVANGKSGINTAIAKNTGTGTIFGTGDNVVGLFAVNGGKVENSGTINFTDSATKGKSGIVIKSGSEGVNTGTVSVTGNNSVGFYNEGSFISDSGISVTGNDSVGVYSLEGSANTEIKAGTITVTGNNGVGVFAAAPTNTGTTIKLGSTGAINLNVSGNDTYAFYASGSNNVFSILDNTTVSVGAGSIGFQYIGSGLSNPISSSDISAMFPVAAGKNLTFNLDPNSYAMVIQKAKISLSNIGTFSSILPSNVSMTGSDKVKIYKGHLEIDENSNIDTGAGTNIKFRDLPVAASSVTLLAGNTITGTEGNHVGIGQENDDRLPLTPNTDITLTNNGVISLNGMNSTGMYTSYGVLNNSGTGVINVSTNGVGLYGTNGTATTNSGVINFGDNGIGIYGTNVTPGTTPTYGTKDINITHSGNIVSNGASKGYGIIADNDTSGSSLITINAGSSIDLSSVTNGAVGDLIGVYAKNTTVNSDGNITIGANGIAVYAEDSTVNMTSGTINIVGDNALGFYLKGATNFTSTSAATINVSGQGVTLFNLNTNPGMTFTNLFTINTIGSGTYTLGSIANGSYYYNNSAALSGNGAMVSAKESTVLFDTGANITSSGDNNIAIYVDNIYTGAPVAGFTAGIEAENRGVISLNNSSAGLYGINGANLYNNGGTISVGNDSTGIYSSGTSSNITNTGTIIIGNNSQGIYLKDGQTADNSGVITSTGYKAVGIYTDNVANPITNNGTINLSGDKSIGIYAVGSAKSIINNGVIKIGDSTDLNDPSIGIYTTAAGDIITNNNTIDSGVKSIGIYSEGAIVNQNGTSTVGQTGTGIYTKGGSVTLGTASVMSIGQNEAVGVYGTNGTLITNNSSNFSVGNGGYGFVLETNSALDNNDVINLTGKGTGVYSDGFNTVTSIAGADINMTGDNNIGYYLVNGGTVNNSGDIIGTVTGKSNIGIYAKNGVINNSGTINVGDSVLAYNSDGKIDYDKSGYAVGIYGEGSQINNTGNITIGENGIGLYTRDNSVLVKNQGHISSAGKGATGIFVDNGVAENAAGTTITMTGDDSIGMVANKNGTIINNGTIIMSGNNVTGMFANIGSTAINNNIIDMTGATGDKSVAFLLGTGSNYINNGTLNLGLNAKISGLAGITHKIPSIVNGGVIQASGVLAVDGISLSIKVDPDSVVYQTSVSSGPQFVANGASIVADTLITDKPITILPGFADGTNANVYKIENAVVASGGNYEFISGSLLWEATPEATGTGANVYMERKAFTDFTEDLWFDDFGTALEEKFLGSTGDAMQIYNKTAYIQTEEEFRQVMGSMAGNVYSNINQREYDMAKALEESLHLLQDSSNNTKENVKISVIAGKGKNKEETDGVTGYDYAMTGILALREVERTYRHTFGYSLGYLHTGFEFKDGNESEEWVDTIQLGIHNKYTLNNWLLRNDITGRASIHNVDRNLDWPSPLERSKMDGTYETYSITSDNILGKEFEIGKKASIMPYGAFKAMYVTRPKFNEKGLEALEVEGNDAWSAKPRAGVELKGAVPLGNTSSWQLKGTLDFAYEYELADLNEREKARLVAIEDGYHKLSKPQDEKGTFRTRAAIGVEVEDRYGIFLTGEYSTGNDKEDDYRAGVTLKAVF